MNKFLGKKDIMCFERAGEATSYSERPFGEEAIHHNSVVHAGPRHSPGLSTDPVNAHGRISTDAELPLTSTHLSYYALIYL